MARHIKNLQGVSVVEGLIALTIVTVVMLFSMPVFHTSTKIVNSFERKGKCERAFNVALNAIERTPDEYRTANVINGYWLPTINDIPAVVNPQGQPAFGIPADPVVQDRFRRFGINTLYQYVGAANIRGDDVTNNGVILYTPLLLSGPMGYLGDLYNTGYCGGYLPAPDFVRNSVNDQTVNLTMRVLRYNTRNRAIQADCNRFWPRSRNQLNSYSESNADPVLEPYSRFQVVTYPDSPLGWINPDHGFQVNLRAQIRDNDAPGGFITCETQKTFNMPIDFHNVMDYLRDFKANTNAVLGNNDGLVRKTTVGGAFPAPTPSRPDPYFKDNTRLLVNNKVTTFKNTDPNLKTIFSNFYLDGGGNIIKERPQCSQTGAVRTNFRISFEVHNLQKEPGTIAMCLDTSTNWLLKQDMQPWVWCQKEQNNNATAAANAAVYIAADEKARSQGWVPCEAMRFCGQAPDAVRVIPVGTNGVRYEYDYSADNSTNRPTAVNPANRLWGCEIKFGVTSVDPAGNMAYVPNRYVTNEAKDEFGDLTVASAMREINPGIYLRPPPCYGCTCKPCKSKGLFGGFFKWFIFIILVVATGGLAWVGMTLTSGFAGLAAASCLAGNMGCGGDPTYVNPDLSRVNHVQCDNVDRGTCKCGQNCKKIKPPGPTWIDDLENAAEYDPYNPGPAGMCNPDTTVVSANGVNFNVRRSYKVWNGNSFDYLNDLVENTDRVAWQQYDAANNRFCYAVHECRNGVWAIARETYTDFNDVDRNDELKGCFTVKTAHEVLWNQKSNGRLPDRGPAICKEVEYGLSMQNPSGQPLWGYNEYNAGGLGWECGQDTGNEGQVPQPLFPAEVNKRFLGRANLTQCPDEFNFDGTIVKPATGQRIDDMAGCPVNYIPKKGNYAKGWGVLMDMIQPANAAPVPASCGFACWASCEPHFNLPENPLNELEMRYYENYNPVAHAALPWCADMAPARDLRGEMGPLDTPF